ncbi:MAG TPA: patatin-like phospholipase family protein, partial [Candidatus Sulfotelmatobacter sp.]|nr:patatin-like phospholipase family protein [Candidatus Sulfotelmatobacter sp.]
VSNSGLRHILETHLTYENIEEARVPLHVIATDLKTGRAVVVSSGPVIPALLASSAIPGVFPPVRIGKRDLVDGAIANHTPIAAAIALGASEIYVLPVGYPWLAREPSGALGMALYALARFVEQKLEVEVMANRHRALIHVLPTFELPPITPADFSQTRELIARGQRWARRYLGAPATTESKPQRSREQRLPALAPTPARAACPKPAWPSTASLTSVGCASGALTSQGTRAARSGRPNLGQEESTNEMRDLRPGVRKFRGARPAPGARASGTRRRR